LYAEWQGKKGDALLLAVAVLPHDGESGRAQAEADAAFAEGARGRHSGSSSRSRLGIQPIIVKIEKVHGVSGAIVPETPWTSKI
jgi:hypothetical protein